MNLKKALGIRFKLIVPTIFIVTLSATVVTLILTGTMRDRMTAEYRSKGVALAKSLSDNAQEILQNRDPSAIQGFIDDYKAISGVAYVYVMSETHEVLVHTFVPAFPKALLEKPVESRISTKIDVEQISLGGLRRMDVRAPILGGALGTAHVGMDLELLEADIRASMLKVARIAAGFALFSCLLLYFLLKKPVGLIIYLAEVSGKIAQGVDTDPETSLFTDDEVGTLARSFKEMVGQVRYQKQNLERLVAERTAQLEEERNELDKKNRTIQTIYENVKSGFLLVDSNGRIQQGFTESCRALLGEKMGAGVAITEALGLLPRQADHYLMMLEQVFEDFLPEEVSLHQVPARQEVGPRVLRLDGSVVRAPDGRVHSVLFTINDITQLRKAEQQNTLNLALIRILQQKEAFGEFLTDCRKLLEECARAASEGNQKRVRFMLHTIKGNASVFGLEELAQLVHSIEDLAEIDELGVAKVRAALREFLEANVAILGMSLDARREEIFTLQSRQLAELESRLDPSVPSSSLASEIRAWIKAIRRRPAAAVLQAVAAVASSIAQRQGKNVEVRIAAPEQPVDATLLREVISNLAHLARNAIDHGIEMPGERGAKPGTASLCMEIGERDGDWVISVEDDGRGIDQPKVVERAIAIGALDPGRQATLTQDERLALIFQDGLSTAEKISQTSGRGVGMSAVVAAVNEIGGSIRVMSEQGKGTRFEIRVPGRPPAVAPARASIVRLAS